MASVPTARRLKFSSKSDPDLSVDLSAVIMAATPDEPRVLTIHFNPQQLDALPSGPLQSQHRTLEMGLRTWVSEQTQLTLGYVEQLHTFGDRDRVEADVHGTGHSLSIAYLALVREARPAGLAHADLMPEGHKRAGPVMSGCTSFHADQARGQCAEEARHLAAAQRPAQDDLSIPVHRVQLEDVLCDIKADRGNLWHSQWLRSGFLDMPILARQTLVEGAIHDITVTWRQDILR